MKTAQPEEYGHMVTEIVETLVHEMAPQKILLYGSIAKGIPREQSDIDLLVITDSDESAAIRQREYQGLFEDYIEDVDISVLTPDEFTEASNQANSFVQSIMNTAVELYSQDESALPPVMPTDQARYVANRHSKEIHDLSRVTAACKIEQMKEKNKRYLISDDEVDEVINEEQYNGCQWCMPDYHVD